MNRKFLVTLLSCSSLFLFSHLPASGETTFTDQGGQTLTLSEPISKAVTIPIPSASMFIAMDGDTLPPWRVCIASRRVPWRAFFWEDSFPRP